MPSLSSTTNSGADYTCVFKTIQRLDDKIYRYRLKSLKNTRSNVRYVGDPGMQVL